MTQPFADADVLFRFVPTEEERHEIHHPEEFAVIPDAELTYGVLSYVKYRGEWHEMQTTMDSRAIIARLLHDRDALAAERDALAAKIEEVRAKKERAYRAAVSDLETTEAERDVYRQAVERWGKAPYYSDIAHAALEAGRKIREGK